MAPLTVQGSLLVLLGGSLGGVARLVISWIVTRRAGAAFPWGTLAVNVSGCLAVGALAGAAHAAGGILATEAARDFLVVGVCGGYTTVSSFSLQTLTLSQQGRHRAATLNVVLSTVVCLLAVATGYRLALGAPW
jgi:CrcB protein